MEIVPLSPQFFALWNCHYHHQVVFILKGVRTPDKFFLNEHLPLSPDFIALL